MGLFGDNPSLGEIERNHGGMTKMAEHQLQECKPDYQKMRSELHVKNTKLCLFNDALEEFLVNDDIPSRTKERASNLYELHGALYIDIEKRLRVIEGLDKKIEEEKADGTKGE